MRKYSRIYPPLSVTVIVLILLSGWNAYHVWQIKKEHRTFAEQTDVDEKISFVKSLISDLRTRVNDIQYPSRTQISDSTSTQNNIFTKENLHIGDTIVGMRVTSMTNRFVYFQGRTTVRGNVSFNDDPKTAAFMLGTVCFDVIEEDWHKLPRILRDDRNVWFCFSNDVQARRLLKNKSGQATVTIDKYVIDSMESSVWNTAELIQVRT